MAALAPTLPDVAPACPVITINRARVHDRRNRPKWIYFATGPDEWIARSYSLSGLQEAIRGRYGDSARFRNP